MTSSLTDGIKLRVELPLAHVSEPGGTRLVKEGYTFNVAQQIGEGTYGQVFTGTCRKTGDKVRAVSAARWAGRSQKIRMDTEKEGFPITAIREIKILSAMKSENVVNLREIVRSEVHKSNNYRGSIYMVFDFCEHDLTGLMHSNKFMEGEVKCLMYQILNGLKYIHENGVLHRDLKASNILIDGHGNVKLADFGLARSYRDEQDSRLTNRVITLWYRPPELLLGADRYGPEVDIWSAGCIMAELLTGKPLFPGKDELDQQDKIFQIMGAPSTSTWPEVAQLPGWDKVPKGRYQGNRLHQWMKQNNPKVTDEAVVLLDKLLRLNPRDRPSAAQALHDLWFTSRSKCKMSEPHELPCAGTSHEYTMKQKRAQEQRQQQHHGRGGGGGGGGGHGDMDSSKRQRIQGPSDGRRHDSQPQNSGYDSRRGADVNSRQPPQQPQPPQSGGSYRDQDYRSDYRSGGGAGMGPGVSIPGVSSGAAGGGSGYSQFTAGGGGGGSVPPPRPPQQPPPQQMGGFVGMQGQPQFMQGPGGMVGPAGMQQRGMMGPPGAMGAMGGMLPPHMAMGGPGGMGAPGMGGPGGPRPPPPQGNMPFRGAAPPGGPMPPPGTGGGGSQYNRR